jgi:hypothetical protein
VIPHLEKKRGKWQAHRVCQTEMSVAAQVLVGNVYTPLFLSRQDTSLALVGEHGLAGELATHANPAGAFASYEQIVAPFVEENQALASSGGSVLLPRSQEELDRRNASFTAEISPRITASTPSNVGRSIV